MKTGLDKKSAAGIKRRKTLSVSVGPLQIGSRHPIAVQSMTSTDTHDVRRTLRQIRELARAGCELIRVAVPDQAAIPALKEIVLRSPLPVIADIHFDFRLALEGMKVGAAGIRINPGNIGGPAKIARIIEMAEEKGGCIRIGVNAGSLEKTLRSKGREGEQAEAMVESALGHLALFEKMQFKNLKISLKSSDVLQTVRAYQILAKTVNYPFHLGITEAGTLLSGAVKSALGIGLLLYQGIGDTLRVSLTAHPREEIKVAYDILRALSLRRRGVEIISCPTCGRCQINLLPLVKQVEKAVKKYTRPLKVAIMGCVVNGPGEAREADIGIAGGKGLGLLFAKGRMIRKIPEAELAESLLEEIEKMVTL
ncbi:MAG: flavodoxin-dependent (E)-4-hydroxy-3-methylbut-2-enyl-diphosphate synthase [Deltaproteobacteria bacterium]|nr:flavodoxin-dependent (E)-4-hydroxy-3-methylbut-2-enyl-diphosphate synthase [Deltaproteobacteria bacterium]